MEKQIQLNRRTEKTNSCLSVVDDSIIKITIWKLSNTKYYLLLFLYIITFGILYIVRFFFQKIFIFIACDCPINESGFNYVLIQTENKEEHVIQVKTEDFKLETKHIPSVHLKHLINDDNSKKILKESLYIDPLIKNNRNNYVFYFRDNKYIYIEESGIFVPVHFDMSKYTNKDILSLFKGDSPGIPTLIEYNYLLNLYGLNRIYLNTKTSMFIFVSFIIEPLYIYNIYGIINWILTEYYIGAGILAILTIFIQIIRTNLEHKNYNQLNSKCKDCVVKRSYLSTDNITIPGEQVVPGDIVFVSRGSIVPFDGIILEGIATVSESDLTGESSLIMKVALESTKEPFSFEGNEKAILYQGSEVTKSKGNFDLSQRDSLMVLVINTGFNTNRGNLIQYFQIKKISNFSMIKDFIKLISVGLFLWICSIVVLYFFNFVNSTTVKFLFDNLSILLSPCISISMGFCSFYFHYTLMKKGISCIESSKMLVSGAVDTIIFDKTGTLTKYDLEINGFMLISSENNRLKLKREDSISTLNKIHKIFWKKKCDMIKINEKLDQNYQYDHRNLPIFLTECLASSHCVDLFNEEPFGNSLDKMLYNIMKWHLIYEDQSLYIIPSNPFEISTFNFNKYQNDSENILGKQNICPERYEYKLKYLHRSEFSSKNQSMCVIVRNMLDNSIRIYSKGAPEKIVYLCLKESIPVNFDEEYTKLTKSGMRVLSCCTRLISENEWSQNVNKTKKEVRQNLETNLIFLGFIVFSNKLKADTKKVISNLIRANCKIMISTGDNPYTTISVAKECGIIKEDIDISILDFEDNQFQLNGITLEKKKENSSSHVEINSLDNISVIPVIPLTRRGMEFDILFSEVFLIQLKRLLDNTSVKICISGHSLSKLIELATQRSLPIYSIFKSQKKEIETIEGIISCLINQIKQKGIIFFRMLPYHKAQLINLIKKDKESIISMCGDGANDCNAIMASDVGIAIRQSKNQCLTSHFFSAIDSIVCVEKIIQNGRACYENHIVLFKAMLLGGVIQLTGTIILLARDYYFSSEQFAFFDFICSVLPIFLATNGSSDTLGVNKPYKSIINKVFIINIVGQTLLQIGLQFGFQIWFANITINHALDIPKTDNKLLLIYPSYMFVCCVFQYIGSIVVFNLHDTNRKKTYNNKIFTYYITILLLFFISIITIKDTKYIFFGKQLVIFEEDTHPFEFRGEKNKILSIVFGIGNLTVYYLYDLLITYIFHE